MSTKLVDSPRAAISGSLLKQKAALTGLLQHNPGLFCLFINGLEDEIKESLLNMEEAGITLEDRNVTKILI